MTTESVGYEIEVGTGTAALRGVLRLASPLAYEELFAPIRTALDETKGTDGLTIDIRQLQFLNSCGVTALSRLILHARSQQLPIGFIGAGSVAWHGRTLSSLQRLYPVMTVELNG